jgi:hypothetical protein
MDDLMTLDEIAAAWKCSSRHARDVIVKQPGFPEPAPGSTQRHRVWLRKEVRGFAHRRSAQIPHVGLQPA